MNPPHHSRSGEVIPLWDQPLDFERRPNLYESLEEQQPPSLRDVLLGTAEAVIDFISDVRFMVGVWVGTLLVCAGAFAIGYWL